MKRTTISHRIGGNQKRQYYRQTYTKIVKNRVFFIAISGPTGNNWQSKTQVVVISDPHSSIVRQKFLIATYLVWKHFFQQEQEKYKLFLVALVSDCFGDVISRPIFNKHFT